MVSGLIEGCLGLLAPWWRKLFPPITSACVIVTIGISLVKTGVNQLAGANAADAGSWPHLLVGCITIAVCIVAEINLKGIWKQLNILGGLLAGYVTACIITFGGWATLVDFATLKQNVASQGLISLPKLCPYPPTFNLASILVFTIVCLASAAETIGATDAVCHSCFKRSATDREIAGSVSCDGFANSLVSALLGCLPVTTYSQNVGILAMTKIVNLGVIATGAGILIVAGLVPPFGAFLASFPPCVFGGCLVIVFGSIVVAGIGMIAAAGLTPRNYMIAALSLSIGMGASETPALFSHCGPLLRDLFSSNPIVLVFVLSFFLALVLPKSMDKEAPNSTTAQD